MIGEWRPCLGNRFVEFQVRGTKGCMMQGLKHPKPTLEFRRSYQIKKSASAILRMIVWREKAGKTKLLKIGQPKFGKPILK